MIDVLCCCSQVFGQDFAMTCFAPARLTSQCLAASIFVPSVHVRLVTFPQVVEDVLSTNRLVQVLVLFLKEQLECFVAPQPYIANTLLESSKDSILSANVVACHGCKKLAQGGLDGLLLFQQVVGKLLQPNYLP